MKRSLKITLGVIVVLLLLVAMIPLFINANTFRPTIEANLSKSLGRKVHIGDMKFSIFTGSLRAQNVTVADDPAFSATPFLQTQNLKIGVEMKPLLFDHQVHVTSFTADEPTVHLIHAANGTWNFSSLGANAGNKSPGQASAGGASQPSSTPEITVGKFEVDNGTVTVASLPPTGNPLVYTNVNFASQNFSLGSRFPVVLSAGLPGNGELKLTGEAGPIAQGDASLTPFNTKLELKHFDPVAAGVVEPSEGIAMVADTNATLVSDSRTVTAVGTLRANRFKFAREGTPARQPIDFAYNLVYNLSNRVLQINSLQPRVGTAAVNIKGTVAMAGKEAVLGLQSAAGGLPIDQVEAVLPAFGVQLPSGSQLQGGTLGFNFNITGPTSATVVSGPVAIDNTRINGFNLGAKMQGLSGANTGNSTLIRSLHTNLTSAPSGIRTDNLAVVVPGLGNATGAGTISPGKVLNYALLLKLDSGVGVLGMVDSLAGQRISTATANGIPVTVTGPASNPSFHADLSNLMKNNAGSIVDTFLNQKGKGSQQTQKPNPSSLINGIMGSK